jgi:NAD/NADP transhydrogenase beta subunit
VSAFFALALLLGIAMTLPIGGADMPVVISLYNALTGLAVGFEGFVLDNAAMIIAGTVVGAAGTLLTQLMAKAMNRSLGNVLFSNFGETGGGRPRRRGHRHAEAHRGLRRRRHDGLLAERSSSCRATAWPSPRPSTRSGNCANC